MKGTNAVRGRDDTTGGLRLQVREIFGTIQGEGPYSGQRAVFIRLTGCALRCFWCDTTWDDDNDKHFDAEDVAELAVNETVRWHRDGGTEALAVITGGEPTNWPLSPLVVSLARHGFTTIQIETAGIRYDPAFVHSCVEVVVSPKTPTIDERVATLPGAYFKYPLMWGEVSEHDGLPLTNTQIKDGRRHLLARPSWLRRSPERVFVTPIETGDPAQDDLNRAQVAESAQRFGYTAQLQIHKTLRLP